MTESSGDTASNSTVTAENAFENYDLKAEAPEARKDTVRFAFEFPDLLKLFRPADAEALEARRISRVVGIAVVILVLSALLLATLGPLLAQSHETPASPAEHAAAAAPADDHAPAADEHAAPSHNEPVHAGAGLSMHTIIGLLAAALGLGGAALGLLGLRRSASRGKWLQARLKTETMRLFHFHYMAARLPELLAVAGDDERRKRYLADRAAAFERIKADILVAPEKELRRIIKRGDETRFEHFVPMMPEDRAEFPPGAEDFFAAWRVLRLDWQGNYCEAKLKKRREGKITTKQLDDIFVRVGWVCVGLIILIHIGHFIGAMAQASLPILEVAVIWIALFALAGRALEDGFQPQREIERYEQYRANVRVAAERFDSARTFSARLEVMRAFERTSLEEMRVFLRTHARAHFLL